MAQQSVIIAGSVYNDVQMVDIPLSGGGTATFVDTSDATLNSGGKLLAGSTAYSMNSKFVGTMADNGATGGTIGTKAGTYTIPAGYTSGGTVSLTNVSDCVSGNILSGKSILGVSGSFVAPTVSQNSTTKVLTIS